MTTLSTSLTEMCSNHDSLVKQLNDSFKDKFLRRFNGDYYQITGFFYEERGTDIRTSFRLGRPNDYDLMVQMRDQDKVLHEYRLQDLDPALFEEVKDPEEEGMAALMFV